MQRAACSAQLRVQPLICSCSVQALHSPLFLSSLPILSSPTHPSLKARSTRPRPEKPAKSAAPTAPATTNPRHVAETFLAPVRRCPSSPSPPLTICLLVTQFCARAGRTALSVLRYFTLHAVAARYRHAPCCAPDWRPSASPLDSHDHESFLPTWRTRFTQPSTTRSLHLHPEDIVFQSTGSQDPGTRR